MGIYNCETTLETSLNSLLDQSYQDFDVILCDDGSIDNTFKIAKKFYKKYPQKFILLKNRKNMGLNYTLNICLAHAKGEYIARMDGDDISLPCRFKKEVEFLDSHLDIQIVSSSMIYFDETGDWGIGKPKKIPQKKDCIKETPFAHAACMVRREAYKAADGYTIDKRLLGVEDYHLWIKMYSKEFKGYNFQRPLYKMRDDQNAAVRRNFKRRLNESYVKCLAVKMLNLPFWYYIFALRPIIVGLIPNKLYIYLHKRRLKLD